MNRKEDLDHITKLLSAIKSEVELSNPSNLTDINIYAENFFRDFLNFIFNYELVNLNKHQKNSAAIDLGDEVHKVAIQVTSNSDFSKIRKTVKIFNDKNLYKKYDKLIILNISMKKKHSEKYIGEEAKHRLNTSSDIWDISDLIRIIGDKSAEEIEKIRYFLEGQVELKNITPSLPNEMKTFLGMIELLSDESNSDTGDGFIEEPDPKGKIEVRFADHTEYLKKEYKELYVEYGGVLQMIREKEALGHVRVRRLRLHLRTISDQFLTQYGGDARRAMDNLVKHFEALLAKQGVEFDSSAIRFFLIDELINCNVFPNKEGGNA